MTKYKFKIIVLIFQCFTIIAALVIVIYDQKTCLSKNCQLLSNIVLKFVNSSINPCDNFYEHSCGKIESRKSENVDRLVIKSLTLQRLRVMHILDQPSFTNEPKSFTMGKRFFKLCQNVEDKAVEVGQVLNLVKQLGGFPTLDGIDWDEHRWSWLNAVIKIRHFGLFNDALFAFVLGFDPNDLMNVIPYVQEPTLTFLPHTLIHCYNGCASYINNFVKVVTDLGADEEQATIDAKEVLSLEIELANNIIKYPSITEEYMLQNNMMTLSNISSTYKFIDWPEFIKGILQTDITPPMDIKVVVVNHEFMNTLKFIFQTKTKRILANYMMWSVLNRLRYRPGRKRKKNDCYRFMETTMPILVQAMYLNKHHQTEYESLVSDMIIQIKNEMTRTINNSRWIDNITKKEAATKVSNIHYRIGFPNEFLNLSFIDEYYKDLSINGSMLNAVLLVEQFYWKEYYSWLAHSFDKTSWGVLSFFFKFIIYIPDANYLVSDNSVNINHGILQEPIFDKDWPSYVNYGRIGSIIGHEISHSLDTTGIHYDKFGKATIWWSQMFWDRYKSKAQCFIHQFNSFKVFNGTVLQEFRGNLSVGENIADSVGLGLSLRVYRSHAERLLWPELKLPNLHYTEEQMFFISFAQFYCSRRSNTNYESTSVHAPNQFRVLGSIQNSRYFSGTFNCNDDNKMHTENKCELW